MRRSSTMDSIDNTVSTFITAAQATLDNPARGALNELTANADAVQVDSTNGFNSKTETITTADGETEEVKIVTTDTGEVKIMSKFNSSPVGKRSRNKKGYKSHKDDTAILLGANYDKNEAGVFACPEGCGVVAKKKFVIARSGEFHVSLED